MVASTSSVAAPLAVVSTAPDDWWAEEAARTGSVWSGVVQTALELMVAVGIIEQPEPEVLSSWDAPSWREAAVEYHRDRPGRLAVEIEPRRLERLRRLLAVDVSLERAWHELRDTRQIKFSNNGISR
jgi:hypothetical protein